MEEALIMLIWLVISLVSCDVIVKHLPIKNPSYNLYVIIYIMVSILTILAMMGIQEIGYDIILLISTS